MENDYKRILDILEKNKLGYSATCLNMYPILEKIYNEKKVDDIVILSAGHAGVAQYVQIEKRSNGTIDAEKMFEDMGVHPSRDPCRGIYATSGSLGSAILIAIGMAIGNPNIKIYCAISDGECAEGNVWEGLEVIKRLKIKNIIIHVNANGFSGYGSVDRKDLYKRLKAFNKDIVFHFTENPSYISGTHGHYHLIKNKCQYNNILKSIHK